MKWKKREEMDGGVQCINEAIYNVWSRTSCSLLTASLLCEVCEPKREAAPFSWESFASAGHKDTAFTRALIAHTRLCCVARYGAVNRRALC